MKPAAPVMTARGMVGCADLCGTSTRSRVSHMILRSSVTDQFSM